MEAILVHSVAPGSLNIDVELEQAHGSGFFLESRDIGDPEVLAALASDVGLDTDAFRRALDKREYAGRVEKLLRHAHDEMDVTGVPLFVVGDRVLTGLQSKDALVAAIDDAQRAGSDVQG